MLSNIKMVPPPFETPMIEVKQFWHRRFSERRQVDVVSRSLDEHFQERPIQGVGRRYIAIAGKFARNATIVTRTW
jgi:hypothetical protein